jgi:hypothetical protein
MGFIYRSNIDEMREKERGKWKMEREPRWGDISIVK